MKQEEFNRLSDELHLVMVSIKNFESCLIQFKNGMFTGSKAFSVVLLDYIGWLIEEDIILTKLSNIE